MTLISDERKSLRTSMRQRRQALSAQDRIDAAQALAEHLRGVPEIRQARLVAGYWAIQGEMSLHALLSPAPKFVYCLPCLTADRHLRFAPWRFGNELVQNRYGIPEPDVPLQSQHVPQDLDIVLVPLLAFDRHGMRLGSGGGYYDRSFAFLKDVPRPVRPLLVGIGYDFQEVEALTPEPWDVPLDLVVTNARLVRCS